jgi:Carboxypeptidase regulatory-like domain
MIPKNTSSKLAAFFLSLVILSQISCKKSDDVADNTPPNVPPVIANDAVKVAATITGSVIDENNQPVASVAVTADTYSTTTDAMGNFTFKNINVSAANGHVMVVKPGYFKGIRSFVTEAGKNNFVKIQLIKQVLSGTVAAAAGGTVNTDGATINFAPNSFVTATGAAYTGNVKVYAKWIDPTAQNLPVIIPGDLRGLNSTNEESILKSYGMVGAELKDDAGNTLKIAPGKTATISFPIPAALQGTAPATIPLWHFDEVAARWREEGTATKTGNTYTAQVNKFSFWNCDVSSNFIKLDMRLVNIANNLPLANTLVKITSTVSNTSAYGYTNDSGFVSGYVPNSETLKLEVIAGTACNTNTVAYTQNIGPYTANASLGTINVTLPANLVINFTAIVKGCNNQPLSNGYISLSLTNGTSALAYTNAIGVVNFSVIQCSTGSIAYTYNAIDLSNGNYSTTVYSTATSNTINLNTITACGNSINTNGVYIAGSIGNNAVLWKDGVHTFLTNHTFNSPKEAIAIETIVYNNDLYVLGTEFDPSSITINGDVATIKLWKNGVLTNITNGRTEEWASGLDVYNGDVYICGYETIAGKDIAKVWKNGIATILTADSSGYAEPTGIKVVNGDIYISGIGGINSQNSRGRALYWKNGTINLLPTGTGGCRTSGIFVNNGDIYLSGYETNISLGSSFGVYWKNGVKYNLSLPGLYTNSAANAIFINNNDVYIAGKSVNQNPYFENATYWKNNTANLLTNYNTTGNYAELYSIFVKNNIVYTVGNFYKSGSGGSSGVDTPIYFQNNIPVPLTGFTSTQNVSLGSIFVQ